MVAKHAWGDPGLGGQGGCDQTWPSPCGSFCGADSGFCRHRMLRWCERHGVSYIVGLAGNQRATAIDRGQTLPRLNNAFQATGEKTTALYWTCAIAPSCGGRRPCGDRQARSPPHKGRKPTLYRPPISTAMPQQLYDQVLLLPVGEMEKPHQGAATGSVSPIAPAPHQWWPQSVLPAVIQSSLCADGKPSVGWALHDTETGPCTGLGTLRLKLLKIGAIILRNTRRIRFFAVECLSLSESLLRGRQAAWFQDSPLMSAAPGTLINNGVRGRVCLEFRKNTLCTARLRA